MVSINFSSWLLEEDFVLQGELRCVTDFFFFCVLTISVLLNKKAISELAFHVPFVFHSFLVLPQLFCILDAKKFKEYCYCG